MSRARRRRRRWLRWLGFLMVFGVLWGIARFLHVHAQTRDWG